MKLQFQKVSNRIPSILYLLLSAIFLGSILTSYGIFHYKSYLVGFGISSLTLAAIYKFFVANKFYSDDPLSPLWNLFGFNIAVFILFYVSSFELSIPNYFWRVSFGFGNFMDFITLPATYASGEFTWISTGHFPFSYAISKIFSEVVDYSTFDLSFKKIRTLYWSLYVVSLIPLLLLIKNFCEAMKLNRYGTAVAYCAILTSYPILVGFERGNFAFITASIMSLVVLLYNKKNTELILWLFAAAISLKTINAIFVLFVLSRFGLKGLAKVIFYVLIIEIVSLLYLFGTDLQQWKLFIPSLLAPLASTVVFTDANKVIGTTGFESFRAATYLIFNNIHTDFTSNSKAFNSVMLLIGFAIGMYMYLIRRKQIAWYEELICLITLPCLFHSSSGDYNLQLILPFILLLLMSSNSNKRLLTILMLPLLLVSGIPVDRILCCGDGTGRAVTLSIKSLLIPYSLSMILFFILCENSKDDRKV